MADDDELPNIREEMLARIRADEVPEPLREALGILQGIFGDPEARFHYEHVEAFAHALDVCKRRPWRDVRNDLHWKRLQAAPEEHEACRTVLRLLGQRRPDAELSGIGTTRAYHINRVRIEPAAVDGAIAAVTTELDSLNQEIAMLESTLGRGDRPSEPWAIMAKMIGNPLLEALQCAGQLAGRKPRRGYGSAKGAIIVFLYGFVKQICDANGEKMPSPKRFLRALEDARTHP